MTYNKDCQDCKSDIEFAKCKQKYQKPQNILLECGEGTGSRTFRYSDDAPFQIAHVTVDTTCLNKPDVLIKFSSQVRIERLDANALTTVRLQYEVSRVCEDRDPISLGVWLFEKVDVRSLEFDNAVEESFNFIFCECINCPRCCDYFVTIIPLEITNARVTVSNGRIVALTGYSFDFPKNEHKNYDTVFKQKHPKLKEIILKCGQGTGSVIFSRQHEPPVRIANVTIDTYSLCKPEVLVEFSSIVSYTTLNPPADSVRLQFELFRVCDNGEPVSRGIWRFEVDSISQSLTISKSFGFIFCECPTFLTCCEYFVTLTPIEVPIQALESVRVSDSRIIALVQSNIVYDKKHSAIDYELKNLQSKKVLLECGQENGSRTFTTSSDVGFQLSQVTIDTTGLCKSEVNIEFSSLVSFEEPNDFIVARLRYELFRICDDGQPECRGVWVLRKELSTIGKVTEVFDFTFCEPIKCKSSCCTYFVTITPIEIENIQVTVSNGRMSALAQ